MWQVELNGIKIAILCAVQSESVGKENWEGHTELDDVRILGREAVQMYEKKPVASSSAMTPRMVVPHDQVVLV